MIIVQIIAALIFFITLPFWAVLYLFIKLDSTGPLLYKQKRLGKDKKPFYIYKFRTMIFDAEDKKSKIEDQNEANGPVFKIYNDPRYMKIGRILAHTGLDELPQLINIIKREMAFVGPRPLPVSEANKVPEKYKQRFSVLPGLTSLWVINGANHNSFARWMKYDIEYVKKKNLFFDIWIMLITIGFIIKLICKQILHKLMVKKAPPFS